MDIKELRELCLASTEAGLTELAAVSELREEYERLVVGLQDHYTNDDFLIFPEDLCVPLTREPTRQPAVVAAAKEVLERTPELVAQ